RRRRARDPGSLGRSARPGLRRRRAGSVAPILGLRAQVELGRDLERIVEAHVALPDQELVAAELHLEVREEADEAARARALVGAGEDEPGAHHLDVALAQLVGDV